jgi:hypothetical protein
LKNLHPTEVFNHVKQHAARSSWQSEQQRSCQATQYG